MFMIKVEKYTSMVYSSILNDLEIFENPSSLKKKVINKTMKIAMRQYKKKMRITW